MPAEASKLLWRRRPASPPDITIYGLGKAWSGRRQRTGTWNLAGRWLSFGLLHFRGNYVDPSKERLVVVHLLKDAVSDGEPRSMEDAAVQAMVSFVSDNNPLGLTSSENRDWTREQLGRQIEATELGADWQPHQLHLDRAPHRGRIKWMPSGYCLVSETDDAFLAISSRRYTAQLRLASQSEVLRTYRLG